MAVLESESSQLHATQGKKPQDTSKWFTSNAEIPAQARLLLEGYSGIKAEEVTAHVLELQKRAFAVCPYPCIGHLRFLHLTTSTHPLYQNVVNRLTSGQTFLDAGCCLGQDLRQLLFDGVPLSKNLFGIDLRSEFFDLGCDLFQDKGKMDATFVACDLTRPAIPDLDPLRESIDVISAQSLFHLLTLEDQKTAAKHLINMTKPVKESLIMGRQVGNTSAKVGGHFFIEDSKAFLHSPETWTQFWRDIGAVTGTDWHITTWAEEAPNRIKRQEWYTPSVIILVFAASRRI